MTQGMTTAQNMMEASEDWPWWLVMVVALILVAAAAGFQMASRRMDYADGTMSPPGCLVALVAMVFATAGLFLLGYAFIG